MKNVRLKYKKHPLKSNGGLTRQLRICNEKNVMKGKWDSKRYENTKAISALGTFVISRKLKFSFYQSCGRNQSPEYA